MPLASKNQLVKKIKEKKELSGIEDKAVLKTLENYLEKYKISFDKILPSDAKILVKEIRAVLRKLVGQYYAGRNLSESDLSSHVSLKERADFYQKLNSLLKELKVKSVFDLGCGLNPIAVASPDLKYFASDIDNNCLSLVKKYFRKNKINGEIFYCDLRNIKEEFPKTDICFLFKVLDTLEKKHAENILKKIQSEKILVSFASHKLSGKKMNFPERRWFEKLLDRLNFKYTKFYSDKEIFYLLKQEKPSLPTTQGTQ